MSHLKIKLNGGNPVVLCSNCDKIIRPATSRECLSPKLYPDEYCDECLQLIIREVGKIKLKE